MEIAATTNVATSAAANGRIGLADNFDNFLKLLTAQLQSQDPLSPLDAITTVRRPPASDA
jgi:flagellar basal-body rod modification protein FlgD